MNSRPMMDVYFVVFDDGGSQAIRGWQSSKIISYYGYNNIKVIYSRDLISSELDYIKSSILIFIKDLHNHVALKPIFLEKLKANGNILIIDLVDSLCFAQLNPLMNPSLEPFYSFIDYSIHCSDFEANTFGERFKNIRTKTIPHPWDLTLLQNNINYLDMKNDTRNRNNIPYYKGNINGMQLDLSMIQNQPIIDFDAYSSEFKIALKHRFHLSFRRRGTLDFYFKPSTKLATAVVCNSLLITSRDSSVIEILGPDYPFYVEDESEYDALASVLQEDVSQFESARHFIDIAVMRLNPFVTNKMLFDLLISIQ